MKPYDKNDNDTYVEKFTNGLVSDMEAHMFKDDKAMCYAYGVHGNFNTTTRQQANNNVLHFPVAKQFDLVLLKSLDQHNLLPHSLMKRYDHSVLEHTHYQKTPIYFDPNDEKFVKVLDDRILRDLKDYKDEFLSYVRQEMAAEQVSIVDNNILMKFNTLNELLKDETKIFAKVRDIYERTLSNFYPSEDVIIVMFNLEENEQVLFDLITGKNNKLNKEIFNCGINFSFLKAKKIAKDTFYFYNLQDELLTGSSFHCEKNRLNKDNSIHDLYSEIMFGEKKQISIMQYSKEDWDLLTVLKENMNDLFSELNTVLLGQKNSDMKGLDFALSDITINKTKMIENSSRKVKYEQ